MDIIKRTIQDDIEKHLFQKKIIVIYGPRQVGKTTLIKEIAKKQKNKKQKYYTCDEADTRLSFKNTTSTRLKEKFKNYELILIDEAQRVENIGLTLKIAIDSMPEKQFIVTGSSSFDLANKINEPLTGRKFTYFLYPFSSKELQDHFQHDSIEQKRLLENRLNYGFFPDVIINSSEAKRRISDLVEDTLYKDVLEHKQLKKTHLLTDLLQALAYQIGNEVSYNELAATFQVSKETIQHYIYLLEQSFIIFRLRPFSRNLRRELRKMKKIYFFDVGIRNALINAFGKTKLRNDIGPLWENFILVERMKYQRNNLKSPNRYFWRTHQQQEIDYLEEKNMKLQAFEFKWNANKKAKAPKPFMDAYPSASFKLINPESYHSFIGLK